MHPRNRYRDAKPDFRAYAATRPSLARHLKQRKTPTAEGFLCTVDFGDPEALRELTCACLEHDFGLQVSIPPGHLIPTVPQKLNYIHWLEDLLGKGDQDDQGPPDAGKVHGIDVGTGPSCIYPLLASRMNGWRFLATEVCPESAECARENVARNSLGDLVTVSLVQSDVVLAGIMDESPLVQYSFCMCNPPFFANSEERRALNSRTGHRPAPPSLPTGNDGETVVHGGEVGFVRRMIADSVQLGNKIRWYTSMLGKKASLKVLRAELKELGVPVVATTTFVQGKTHRWGLAWSFDPALNRQIPGQSAGKSQSCFSLELAPFPADLSGLTPALDWMQDQLRGLEIDFGVLSEDVRCIRLSCKAVRNTWSHQRKRRRLKSRLAKLSQHTIASESEEGAPPPPVAMTTEQTVAQREEESENLIGQLEELSTPCRMEFLLTVSVSDEISVDSQRGLEPPLSKKVKESKETGPNGEGCVMATLQLISGDSSDQLHNIVQYLKNQFPASSPPASTLSPLPHCTTNS